MFLSPSPVSSILGPKPPLSDGALQQKCLNSSLITIFQVIYACLYPFIFFSEFQPLKGPDGTLFEGCVQIFIPADVGVTRSDHGCTFILRTVRVVLVTRPLLETPSQTIPGPGATSSCFLSSKALGLHLFIPV